MSYLLISSKVGRWKRTGYGPMDRPTDRRTDKPSYRDAWTHLIGSGDLYKRKTILRTRGNPVCLNAITAIRNKRKWIYNRRVDFLMHRFDHYRRRKWRVETVDWRLGTDPNVGNTPKSTHFEVWKSSTTVYCRRQRRHISDRESFITL